MTSMPRTAVLSTLLAAALNATPAVAAEGRQCIEDALSLSGKADAVAIAIEARPATDEFRAAAIECARTHGWSNEAANDAMFFTVGALAVSDLTARAPFSSAQFSRLQAILDGISDSDMRLITTAADGVSQVYSAIARQSISDGLILSRDHSTFIGQYAAARATERIYGIDFDSR